MFRQVIFCMKDSICVRWTIRDTRYTMLNFVWLNNELTIDIGMQNHSLLQQAISTVKPMIQLTLFVYDTIDSERQIIMSGQAFNQNKTQSN